jgi:hypothetical protein
MENREETDFPESREKYEKILAITYILAQAPLASIEKSLDNILNCLQPKKGTRNETPNSQTQQTEGKLESASFAAIIEKLFQLQEKASHLEKQVALQSLNLSTTNDNASNDALDVMSAETRTRGPSGNFETKRNPSHGVGALKQFLGNQRSKDSDSSPKIGAADSRFATSPRLHNPPSDDSASLDKIKASASKRPPIPSFEQSPSPVSNATPSAATTNQTDSSEKSKSKPSNPPSDSTLKPTGELKSAATESPSSGSVAAAPSSPHTKRFSPTSSPQVPRNAPVSSDAPEHPVKSNVKGLISSTFEKKSAAPTTNVPPPSATSSSTTNTPNIQASSVQSAAPSSESSPPPSAPTPPSVTPTEKNVSATQKKRESQFKLPSVLGLPSLPESYAELGSDIRKSISEIAATSSSGLAMYKLAEPKDSVAPKVPSTLSNSAAITIGNRAAAKQPLASTSDSGAPKNTTGSNLPTVPTDNDSMSRSAKRGSRLISGRLYEVTPTEKNYEFYTEKKVERWHLYHWAQKRHRYSLDKRIDDNLQRVLDECRSKGIKFIDPEFPPNEENFQPDSKETVTWKRLGDIYQNKAPVLFCDNGPHGFPHLISRKFRSKLSGLLAVPANHSNVLMNLFSSYEYNEYGVYSVRLYNEECRSWETFLVDDFVPCKQDGLPINLLSSNSNELWPLVLEKAIAKKLGSYKALASFSEKDVLVKLTGIVPEQFTTKGNRQELFISLFDHYIHQNSILCSIKCENALELLTRTSQGLLRGHCYYLMEIREGKNLQLMKFRNPSSEENETLVWCGDYSWTSLKWTPDLQAEFGFDPNDKTVFYMSFEDFVKYFDTIYVCGFNSVQWCSAIISGDWRDVTAGGCDNYGNPLWRNNNQFFLVLPQRSTLTVILSQPEIRTPGHKYHYIGFYVAKGEEQGYKRLTLPKEDVVYSSAFYPLNHIRFSTELPEGNYCIIPCTFEPHIESSYSLFIQCSSDFQIDKAKDWFEYRATTTMKYAPLSDNSARPRTISTRFQDLETNILNLEASIKGTSFLARCSNPLESSVLYSCPQFSFTVTLKTKVCIVVDIDTSTSTAPGHSSIARPFIGFTLFKREGGNSENRLTQADITTKIGATPFTDAEVYLMQTLNPGKYVIIATPYDVSQIPPFKVTLYSHQEIKDLKEVIDQSLQKQQPTAAQQATSSLIPTPSTAATQQVTPTPTPPTPPTTQQVTPTPTPPTTQQVTPTPTTTQQVTPTPTPPTTQQVTPTPTPPTTQQVTPTPTPPTTQQVTPTPTATQQVTPTPTQQVTPTPTPPTTQTQAKLQSQQYQVQQTQQQGKSQQTQTQGKLQSPPQPPQTQAQAQVQQQQQVVSTPSQPPSASPHATEQAQNTQTNAAGGMNFKQPSLEIVDKLSKRVKSMSEFIATLNPKSSVETLAEAVKVMKTVLRMLKEIDTLKDLLPPTETPEVPNVGITDPIMRTKNTVTVALAEISADLTAITKLLQSSPNFQSILPIVQVLQALDHIIISP